jgi:glutaredoxin
MSLLSRLVRPRRQTNAVAVTVYTRQECCCCDKALAVLKKYQRKHRLVIEQVDVDADPELVALHGESVPVVAIAGKIRFRGVVNPALLERLLVAMRRGA